MAYKSQINLGGLGEVPRIQDNDVFADMTDVYNAIHILTQWTDALVVQQQEQGEGKNSDHPPWENMPFERWYWAPAAVPITTGNVVTVVDCSTVSTAPDIPYTSIQGVVRGCALPYTNHSVATGTDTYRDVVARGGVTGLALNDAAEGELVQIGIGSAIIRIDGVTAGRRVFAKPWAVMNTVDIGLNNVWFSPVLDGTAYILPEDIAFSKIVETYFPVGIGVADNAAMFIPSDVSQLIIGGHPDEPVS